MSEVLFNILYGFVCFLLLVLCGLAMADSVYVTTDKHGRLHYSDQLPPTPYQLKEIQIENDYPWAEAPEFKPSKKTKRKKSRVKKQKRYTLAELKTRCQAARGKYNSYRASDTNANWDTYRAKLERYKAKRDEWCGRLLKGR